MNAKTAHLWRLDNADTTVLVTTGHDDVPEIAWFGPALSHDIDLEALVCVRDLPNPNAKLDTPTRITLFPTHSTGFLGASALSGHRHGAAFAPVFHLDRVAHCATQTHHDYQHNNQSDSLIDDQVSSTREQDKKDNHTLVFVLRDERAALAVTITLTLDQTSSVLTFDTTLKNEGDSDYQLDWLASATLPLNDQFEDCLTLHGRWGGEFQQSRHRLSTTRLQIDSIAGRTSHEHFPGIICGTSGFGEQQGHVIGLHLASSSSHRTVTERLSDGRAYIQTGAIPLAGELNVAPGAHWQAPTTYVCTAHGLNQLSGRFHRFVRQHILPRWTRAPRPVHANSWEALYFNHNTPDLLALIDAAADIGAERFVLDDGWFVGRRDDTAGLGDWRVDSGVYPNGLSDIVQHVRDRGMQFGLWFEPEMVNPDSNLYREHPEWALHVDGYTTPLARHQLVLNLMLPDVQAYLYECIAALVQRYSIDYIKWDHNRDLVLPGNGTRACLLGQSTACFALMDKLVTAFPSLEIESCSSGGGRADYAVLKRTGRVWTSDNIDPIDRLSIQRGFSLFFPPEIMGSHVGHDVAHLTGRSTNLHTRAIVALQGQYGFELDARKLDAQEHGALGHYTQLYKQHRQWMSESTTVRLPLRNQALVASGMVSQDQTVSLWSVIASGSLHETAAERLVLVGLDPATRYTVTLKSNNAEELAAFAKHTPLWMRAPVTLQGDVLMSVGLTLPALPPQQALLIECSAHHLSR